MTEENFWRRVTFGPSCWNWTGAKNKKGYGHVSRNGKRAQATWMAWELAHGSSPTPGLFVCHTCDNPACVNPDHLWLGTNQQNMDDRAAKGRNSLMQGERHGAAKLTTAKVIELRSLRASGKQLRELSQQFGVSRMQISRICRGINWKGINHEAQVQETHQEA